MNHGNMGMDARAELSKLSGRDFDIAYMSMMIEHHRGAVMMAQQVLRVSQDERIRGAARDIIRVQNQEITQLTGWLRSWYGVSPSQRYMTMMGQGMTPMMDSSMPGMMGGQRSADRAFLEGMILHHQDAVDMSELCLRKAARSELTRFCQGVIDVQTREIAQFRAWLKTLK
jgi:uncharacterized protein (DUF305 family)